MPSRVRGAGKIRRMLRSMPDAVRGEIVVTFEHFGREMATVMRSRTPRRSGALVSRISYKVFARSLRMQVGLLGSKRVRARVFYGRILDLGRRARTVQARRRTKSGAISTYALRVKGLSPQRFVTGPIAQHRSALNRQTRDIFLRALRRTAQGGDE